MTFTSKANTTYIDGNDVDKVLVRELWGDVDGIVTNGGKMYGSRADAVSAGQAALPTEIGHLLTVEGFNLVIRRASASADDPLFGTAPQWGVYRRIPTNEMVLATRDPLIDGQDVAAITMSGTYQGRGAHTYLNMPPDWPAGMSFELRVSKILLTAGDPNGRFIMQRITALSVDAENTGRRFRRSYERMADTLNPGITGQWAWVRTDVVRPLADATYVTLGDSITQGGNGFFWQPLVAGLTGASRVVNGGFGGATMATHPTGPNFTEMSSYKVAEAILNDNWTAVVAAAEAQDGGTGGLRTDHALALQALDWSTVTHVSVFYGTNDFSNDVPLGTPADTTGDTFYGALNRTIIDMLTGRPQIRLTFLAPIWRTDAETPNSLGLVLKDYTDAILNRADAYNIPVADLTRNCGINSINSTTFLSDGVHPRNTAGNDHVAGLVASAILGAAASRGSSMTTTVLTDPVVFDAYVAGPGELVVLDNA